MQDGKLSQQANLVHYYQHTDSMQPATAVPYTLIEIAHREQSANLKF